MPSVVVTGANSGIGHAFAKLLVAEGYDVYATDQHVGDKLLSLGCPTAELDVSSPESIQSFRKTFGEDKPLDVLLNIAGIMPKKEDDSLTSTVYPSLLKTFSVNTFGPLLLTSTLLPNLKKAQSARVGIMSSRVGSIADNSSGGAYAYRSSKAAVNAVGKSMSIDLKDDGIVVVLMHPGFVKTGLDPTTHHLAEAVEPEEAASKLWAVFKSKSLDDTGKFWHREGMELPW